MLGIGLTKHEILIADHILTRFSFHQEIDIYRLLLSFKKNCFFSMSTSLNLQGFSNYRNDFLFLSCELTPKDTPRPTLTQENIDNAFSKPYRRTHSIGKYNDLKIVFLTPKYSNNYAVIKTNHPVSSINRALVEMIINVQYFRSSLEIIQTFDPLKSKLNLTEIFNIISEFNLIYPYFQCIGYYLEQIGFAKSDLKQFKDQVTELKFYTDKNQASYEFDSYWNMYHI
jgi:hypothetical protein